MKKKSSAFGILQDYYSHELTAAVGARIRSASQHSSMECQESHEHLLLIEELLTADGFWEVGLL